ncbi:MAG: geranylgeranylglycerol-phosphate geranylgeranyltransferase [Bacteroidales bacterium]|nr:geranylgeranylglycerol-phosphate geranylgeranyltransferase [Bacteroidales bacterium]
MTHSRGSNPTVWEKTKGIARFIRLPNLIIVVLIEFLLRYGVLNPILFNWQTAYMTSLTDFIIFVLATLLLAVGGYVINDYFDQKIDRVNRPDTIVVSRIVSPRMAMKIHILVNTIAVILGFYLAYRIHSLWFGLLFPCGALFFWFYSARWKQQLIWKNLIVAFISASLILLVLLFEFFHLRLYPDYFSTVIGTLDTIFWIFLSYAVFAFLVSLFREIVKDIEDLKGDEEFGTRSLPAVIGIGWSKLIVVLLILITMGLLAYAQVSIHRFGFEILFWYFTLAVQLPSLYLVIAVIMAKKRENFRFASGLAKLIMFTGILSLLVIYLSY